MKNNTVHKQPLTKTSIGTGKQYNYNEIVDFLDQNWTENKNDTSLSCLKQLDAALGSLTQSLNVIVIAGSNGKSLTTYFSTQLLKEEGLKIGAFYTPHILTYNERFLLDNESIANKNFTDIGNEVINTAHSLNIKPNSYEILLMMALVYFKQNNADVVLIESPTTDKHNPCGIFTAKIVAVTRITDETIAANDQALQDILSVVKADTHVVSADQSKINLQAMQDHVEKTQGIWAMPIRKLAPLEYPFEQLHGRCAALAERIAQIYINTFAHKDAIIVSNSLLTKQKGQRGRPTIEAKRQLELHPKKTVEQFWKDTCNNLPARFELLDKEKPTILLDNASNIDAFQNLLLGIRLLHYQRPLKGLTLILGCTNNALDITEFLKLLRYFFKKTSGQVIVCPAIDITKPDLKAWDIEKITNDIKGMKIKAKSSPSFKDAFETAQKTVDERHGLVVITGSSAIVSEYWRYKGIKKF